MTLPDTATRAKAREIARKIVAVAESERHNQGMGHFVYEAIVPIIEAALLSSGGIDGEPVAGSVAAYRERSWLVSRLRWWRGHISRTSLFSAETPDGHKLVDDLQDAAGVILADRHPAPREAAEGERLRAALFKAIEIADEAEGRNPDAGHRQAADAIRALASPVPGSE